MRDRFPNAVPQWHVAILLAALAPNAARAEPQPPTISVEARDSRSEVTFRFPRKVPLAMHQVGDVAILNFTKSGTVPDSAGTTGTVAAIHGGMDHATIQLVPGAHALWHRQGNSIVVTIQDLPGAAPPAASPPPAPAPAPTTAAAAAAAPRPSPAAPAEAAAPQTAAAMATLPPGTAGTAALLPFGPRIGAAAFRRNGAGWIVFDERRAIDLAALQGDPLLSHATVQLLTAATLLRIPLDDAHELRLNHAADGWTLAAMPSAPPGPALPVTAKPEWFEVATAEANQVVVVPDMDTGQNLLVGTLRANSGGMPVARRVPAFALDATWLGVVVEPISDATTMHNTPAAFLVGTTGQPLAAVPDAVHSLADAAFMTRRFDIPTGDPAVLLRQLHAAIATAGLAPAQSRAQPRKQAAALLLALGFGVEAQSMLRLAAEEDPRLAADPETTGLAAIAAMLSGRTEEAAGINDPALAGSDEVALWRAVYAAQTHEGAPAGAAVFAATMPLLLAYPLPLRNALLPLAAETMAQGGAPAAADALIARLPNEPLLDYAHALRLEASGDTAQALTKYADLMQGHDRLAGARAAQRATELRLKTGAITPAQAADALESQFLNWRGDNRELDLRLRVAQLRAQTGAWRAAFSVLHETAAIYPDSAPVIQTRMAEFMNTLLTGAGAATLSPLDLVALTEENAELVAAVAPAQAAGLMADKLLALDLPRRAGPVLERMMAASPVGEAQATLGARLATLRLNDGDDAGAQAALAGSNAPGLPQPLIDRRNLVAARLAAHAGHADRAMTILAGIDSAAADELRASILTDAQDWHGAADAIRALAAKTVPTEGPLASDQQDMLLRLASAMSRAGDDAGLRALGQHEDARMEGPRGSMFRLLTAAPISNVADLRRSSSELSLAKAIPSGLAAIGSH